MSPTKYLSDVEYRDLREKLILEPNLLLELLLVTGSRASEILNLRVGEINHDARSVFIHGLKGSWDRELPLPDDLYFRLVNRCDGRGSSERVFPINYRRLHYIWQNYRTTPKKLHSLRHTYAVRAFRKHQNLLTIRKALGHKDFKNTLIYTAVVSVDDLRENLEV